MGRFSKAGVTKNFRVAYLWYAEIKHSHWFDIVMVHGIANQRALFQRSIDMLL